MLKNFDATSIRFPAFEDYCNHVIKNHPGYSPEATNNELSRFKDSLPFCNDYQKKLAHKIQTELYGRADKKHKRYSEKLIGCLKLIREQKLQEKQKRNQIIEEWMLNH